MGLFPLGEKERAGGRRLMRDEMLVSIDFKSKPAAAYEVIHIRTQLFEYVSET